MTDYQYSRFERETEAGAIYTIVIILLFLNKIAYIFYNNYNVQ